MALRVNRMSRKRMVLIGKVFERKRRRLFKGCFGEVRLASPSRGSVDTSSFLLKSGEWKGSMDSLDFGRLPRTGRGSARRGCFDAELLPYLLQLGQLESMERSRIASRRSLLGLGALPGSETLACGLQQEQALDLMSRDLTPEDFEMLSKLDEGVAKRNIAEKSVVELLPRVAAAGKECGVCLGELDGKIDAIELPCKHVYHSACISKWLTTCKNACPMCSAPIEIHRPAPEMAGA